MYLSEGFVNQNYVIDKIHCDEWNKLKLKRMALVEGCVIRILQKHTFYPFLIENKRTRIAFSQSLAEKIEVIPYV